MFAVRYLRPAAVMLLLLLVCLAAGGCRSGRGEKDGETVTTVPETTLDPQEVRAGEIKSRVLEVINSDSGNGTINTDDLFGKYCGDYMISDIEENSCPEGLDFIALRSDVTTTSYKDKHRSYSTMRGGYDFTINHENSKYKLRAHPCDDADTRVPSVFYDFGIDISAFYSPLKDSGARLELPDLTADMLTVDDELSSCTFSDEYMNEFARALCISMEYTDEQTKTFIERGSFKGTYYVEPERVEFSFSSHKKGVETVGIWFTSYASPENGNSIKMEFKPLFGTRGYQRMIEITVRDLEVGSDGKLVSGTFVSNYTYKGMPFNAGGVRGETDGDESVVIKIDTRDSAEKNLDVVKKSEVSILPTTGSRVTGGSDITMSVAGGCFRCVWNSNDKPYFILNGKFSMGTPDMPALPEEAEKMIEDYLSKNGAA